MGRNGEPLHQRFWSKVNVGEPHECWEWHGSRCGKNRAYGQILFKGHKITAHRASWILAHPGESIPEGMDVCHTCDNGACVNPDHLFVGTARDNMLDKIKKGRSNMPRGVETGMHKLNDTIVRDIRAAVAQGMSRKMLAQHYGVSEVTVTMIVNRKTWRHVE